MEVRDLRGAPTSSEDPMAEAERLTAKGERETHDALRFVGTASERETDLTSGGEARASGRRNRERFELRRRSRLRPRPTLLFYAVVVQRVESRPALVVGRLFLCARRAAP